MCVSCLCVIFLFQVFESSTFWPATGSSEPGVSESAVNPSPEHQNDTQPYGEVLNIAESSSEEDSSSSSSRSSCEEFAESNSSSDEDTESLKSSSEPESEISEIEENYNSDNSDSDDQLHVFEGCALTVDEGVLVLMNLFVKHQMEKIVVGDILKGLLRFCPKSHNLPKSQHLLFKHVKDLIPLPPEKVHYYCADCLYYFGIECPMKCPVCDGEQSHKFFQLSLSAQIKNLFENHGLADKLDDYAARRLAMCEDNDLISDLGDGTEFKRAKIAAPYSLTLMGHTDGLSIHDSADLTLWPLEFVIVELPPHLRYRYVLVSGVWLDGCKPYINSYFKPFVKELQTIYEDGVQWIHPKTKELHTSRVTCPVFCADAPARAGIQNVLQHGGKYCCNICEQKMKKLPADPVLPGIKKKPRRRVFTFQENSSRLRTAERMEKQGEESRRRQEASQNKKLTAVKGVRGMSVISDIPGCDRSSAVFPEYMHLLLCLIKEFFTLWFEKEGPWSLKDKRDEINAFLEEIRVPDFITRITRSTECFRKWKANELRSFVLYYSPIILKECMKEEYFQHWMLLVHSLYLLLKDNISKTDIAKAEIMLKMFCRDFSRLYKADHYTYYVHNLLHLPLSVQRYGPLWSNAAFQFESFNGTLAKFIHGTKHQAQELVNNIQLAFGVEILKARVANYDSRPDYVGQTNNQVEFCNEVKVFQFSDEEKALLLSHHFKEPFKVFYRAKIRKGEVLTCFTYRRQKRRSNFSICYFNSTTNQREYGDIKCFVQCAHDPNLKMAYVKRFAVHHLKVISHIGTNVILDHVIPMRETDMYLLVGLSEIISKVIKVKNCVCLRPNKHEVNL